MIQINDRFYINSNSNCYTLQEKVTIQDTNSKNYGQEMFKDLGYYTTIEGCINGILKTNLREYVGKSTQNTLKELQEEIKRLNQYLKSLKLDI